MSLLPPTDEPDASCVDLVAGRPGSPVSGAPELDQLAATVRARLGVPVALVSLVQPAAGRQALPGLAGVLPEPYAAARETPLTHSFCRYVVHDRQPLVISDARADPRLRGNPAIESLGVVAYAGYPLLDVDGTVVGSLCAIDHAPRRWTTTELEQLEQLAAGGCELIRRLREGVPRQRARTDETLAQRAQLMLTLSEALAGTLDVSDVATAVSSISVTQLGCLHAGLWLRQSDLPRSDADLAPGATPDPSVLCWARDDDGDWHQASAHDRIGLDLSTPVGRAALTSESTYFESTAQQNAAFPLLAHPRQKGGRRAFLPLISRGRLFGGLALLWPDPGPVEDEERATVTALASYAAQALERASLRQERSDALLTLQRTLMPALPATEEVQLASRYLPASSQDQIGGDWYDALVSAPGSVAVTIGDVIGHDVTASASMGQLRTMLRVLSSTTDDGPAALVGRLDRAIADLDVSGMATLVHATLTRRDGGTGSAWDLRWTNAGHPPPLVLLPGGDVHWLERDDVDTLVGVAPETRRHDHHEVLPAGATLLLYTDGLVERRGEHLQVGLRRLERSLLHHGSAPLEDLLDAVCDDLLGRQRGDDVALLGVRLTTGPAPDA